MSLFNTVVPPHPLAPYLLRAINWAQPDDPEKKYSLLGRVRYVWMDKDNNIKILLKDGPESWSEEKDEVMKQVKGHESFVSVEVLERDPVYLIATFAPLIETHYDRGMPIDEFIENIGAFDSTGMSNGWASILTHPFDIFDAAMKKMEAGEMSPRIKKVAEGVKDMLDQSSAERELEEMTTSAKVDGLNNEKVKVFSIDTEGNLEDKTEDFTK